MRVDANLLTVGQLVALFMEHGTADFAMRRGTCEIQNYRDATAELLLLYAELPCASFDVLHLKAVRQLMIENGLARSTINKQRIRRIKGVFRWATEHHGLDGRVAARLATVKPLRPGVDGVQEAPARLPATMEQVVAVLCDQQCPKVNRDMLKFQKLTGARPGEVCGCLGSEVDQSRSPWIWIPQMHKNAWREKSRVIHIGPAAQLVILPYLSDRHLFQTKRGRPFRVDHYHQMIDESCRRVRVPHFSPQMVRRMAATEADEANDIETAQELLGHSDVRTTELYLNRGGKRAKQYAQDHG